MSSASVAETKNNLSAILAALASGTEREHLIKKRDVPVAVIRPYSEPAPAKRQFGFAKDDGWEIDWEAFDAMDAEIMKDMGLE